MDKWQRGLISVIGEWRRRARRDSFMKLVLLDLSYYKLTKFHRKCWCRDCRVQMIQTLTCLSLTDFFI